MSRTESRGRILRSRLVLPVTSPPIDDGAVVVRGTRIEAVGRWAEIHGAHASAEVTDLGGCVLLPGLINAHCHLDYTDMAGQLPPPKSFSDWIKSIVALKAGWGYGDFARSWLNGAQSLLRSGVTTVIDIEAVPELVPEATASTPLRVVSCLELIAIKHAGQTAEIVDDAAARVRAWPVELRGLSPHAPFTTSAELLLAAAQSARANGWLLTTHVAESVEEFDMFAHARGPLFQWLKSQRDCSDCGTRSPVQHLEAAGVLSPGFLAVHANYVSDDDITLLATRGASVVHCPRSHEYFGHQPFRLDAMRQAGVNLCLGTDSMATVRRQPHEPLELNLLADLRAFARVFPNVGSEEILRMVTVNAAKALGRSGDLGELSVGARADLIAMPLGAGDPFESVVQHRGPVAASMIDGRWGIEPNL